MLFFNFLKYFLQNYFLIKYLNLKNCTLVLLDQTASITVDDCRDCLIICGPCRGRFFSHLIILFPKIFFSSLFLRDCKNLLVLAICQQFRTRDCQHLNAHLFCTTCPTIEETNLKVAPLLLNYCGLQSIFLI